MANQKHVEILKQGVKTWNAWRRAHPKIRPDLFMANLSRLDLCRADLREADLRGAALIDANLTLTNLGYANLRGTDLRAADLTRAGLALLHETGRDGRPPPTSLHAPVPTAALSLVH